MLSDGFISVLIFFVLISLLIFSYFKIAKSFGFETELKRHNSKHKTVVGAGIIFPIVFILSSLFYGFDNYIVLLGVMVLSIIGLLDDIKPVSFLIRLMIQAIVCAVILSYSQGYHISLALKLLLFFFLLSYINAFNFMDGINGMLGLQTTIVFICLAVINNWTLVVPPQVITGLIISALLFTLGNLMNRPFFISGDVGSISLGLIIGFIMIKFYLEIGNPMIFILSLIYATETGYTFLTNLSNRVSIIKPHKNHLYEQLVFKFNKKDVSVSLVYAAIQLLLACLVVCCCIYEVGSWLMLFVIASSVFIIYSIFRRYILRNEVRRKNTN